MEETSSSQESAQTDGNRVNWDTFSKIVAVVLSVVTAVWAAMEKSPSINLLVVIIVGGCCLLILLFSCCCDFQLNNAEKKCLGVTFMIAAILSLLLLGYDRHSVNRVDLLGSASQGTCWQNVEYKSKQLSEDVDFWKSNMIDVFLSHNLLTVGQHQKLVLETYERLANAEGEQKVDILKHVHFRLLTEMLPLTADEGYLRFCDILRNKSDFSALGLLLCKECNSCCSGLLNGIFENGICTLQKVELTSALSLVNSQTETRVAHFIMDSPCKAVFDRKEKFIHPFLENWDLNITVLDNKNLEITNVLTAVAPHNFSLICYNSRISVEMIVPQITPAEIDHQSLKGIFAKSTGIQVMSNLGQLCSVPLKEGSLVLLHLSAKAGFDLLAIFGNSRRKNRFAESLGTAFHTDLKSTYVQLQVSGLPRVEILIQPSGGFRIPERSILDVTLQQALICIPACLLTFLVGFATGRICHKTKRHSQLVIRDAESTRVTNPERDRDETLGEAELSDVDAENEQNETVDVGLDRETGVRTLPHPSGSYVEPGEIMSRLVVTDACAADGPRGIDNIDANPSQLMDSQLSNSWTSAPLAPGDRQCTENDIRKIYRKVSLYWYKLGVELRVDDYKLDSIKQHEKTDDERCYKMLKFWLNQALHAATVYTLLNAIREIDGPVDAIERSNFDRTIMTNWKMSLSNGQQDGDTTTAS